MPSITWNSKLQLVLTDIDDTIATVYEPARPEMVAELERLLHDGVKIFMVSGRDIHRITWGITDYLSAELRKNILIAYCSGAEVRGFDADGTLHDQPFYSAYEEAFTDEQKQA